MDDRRVIKASAKKIAWLIVLGGSLTALSAILIPIKPLIGWVGTVFFGGGLLLAAFLMRPSTTYLVLDRQGFEVAAMGRRFRTAWSDVDGFYVGEIYGTRMVGITYSPTHQARQGARAVASALGGMEGGIGDHYELPIGEVCEMLNQWRAAHGGAV